MAKRPRRNRALSFKAKVGLSTVKGEKTITELAQQFDVHPSPITRWRNQLLDGAAGVFDSEVKTAAPAPTVNVKTLHAKIGALALANDFCPARSGRPDF